MQSATLPGTRIFFALLLCIVAYGYVFPYFPRLNNPNENVRVYMTAAMVEEGTYEISGPRQRWGWTNDAAAKDGKYYSVKAPGTSFLGYPGYWFLHRWRFAAGREVTLTEAVWVCRVTASILPTVLFMLLFYGWISKQTGSPIVRDSAFLSIAMGSMLYAYGLLFVSHTASAACAMGGFMLTQLARSDGGFTKKGAWFTGLLVASTTFFEYPGFVASVLLTIYAITAFRTPAHWVLFGVGALIPTLAVMHFHYSAFGNPLTPGHVYMENPWFRDAHEQGFYGATQFHPDAIVTMFVDLGSGLLPMTPILIFAVLGFPRLLLDRESRVDAVFALLVTVGTVVLIAYMNNWRGGWTVGPRYLALTVPFLLWGAVVGLDWLHEHFPTITEIIALACAAVAMIASGIPSLYYPHVPPEISRPLPELFLPLITYDFAPTNLGEYGDYFGTLSMAPMALLFVIALVWAWTAEASWKHIFFVPLAGALLLPHFITPKDAPSSKSYVARITRKWDPPQHDKPAILAQDLMAHGGDAAKVEKLAVMYEALGRTKEAKLTREGFEQFKTPTDLEQFVRDIDETLDRAQPPPKKKRGRVTKAKPR
ncbi:MAG: hypothetical protein KC416_14160 [Myxococcales bacterium]|nr:hypothetical protein [Myxococcales bacterium]